MLWLHIHYKTYACIMHHAHYIITTEWKTYHISMCIMNIKLIFIIAKTWPINMERYIYIYIKRRQNTASVWSPLIIKCVLYYALSLSISLVALSFSLRVQMHDDWIVMYNVWWKRLLVVLWCILNCHLFAWLCATIAHTHTTHTIGSVFTFIHTLSQLALPFTSVYQTTGPQSDVFHLFCCFFFLLTPPPTKENIKNIHAHCRIGEKKSNNKWTIQ